MTDADKCRAVAEACGQRVYYYRNSPQPYMFAKDGSIGEKFDPLHNPAQCIEALHRKFVQVDTCRDRDMVTVKAWLSHKDGMAGYFRGQCEDPDPVKAFCAASVDCILAAAKGENHA